MLNSNFKQPVRVQNKSLNTINQTKFQSSDYDKGNDKRQTCEIINTISNLQIEKMKKTVQHNMAKLITVINCITCRDPA